MKYLIFLLLAACSTPKPALKVIDITPSIQEQPTPPNPAPVAIPAVVPVPVAIPEVKPAAKSWRLSRGKLQGEGVFGFPALLSKTKNKKGNGTTTETCYRYSTFAVVELRSTDEIGSGELTLRLAPPRGFNLCNKEFRGKTVNLRLIEGYFAGVAGGYIVVDGADSTEGQTEFQLFDTQTGTEVLKSYHHPTEEFVITSLDNHAALEYFAKLSVKCELASEGATCWKRVVAENKVNGSAPMPDCKNAFAKSNTPLTEPALVFGRARIARLGVGKPVFLGGKSTCQAAP